jgi:hypothetical protein
MLVVAGVDGLQHMEGIDAGVQGKEVAQYCAEQVKITFTEEASLIYSEARLHASHGQSANQPVDSGCLCINNGIQTLAV